MQLRLDKYLADMGVGTRSEVKQYIRKHQVTVNGAIANGPDQKVEPCQDQIMFQGAAILYEEFEYYMLYKPKGCVSAVTDARYPTVLDCIKEKNCKDLFPVGRLDLDTEGLLLITNDGPLAHNLLAPGKHVPKAYFAKVDGEVTEKDVTLFAKGVEIGEKHPTLPAKLKILSCKAQPGQNDWISEVELTITEGRFHQVKRMFEAVGKHVMYLKRLSMGSLQLDNALQPGEYRALTKEEIDSLKHRR